jgi:hypothetical protein
MRGVVLLLALAALPLVAVPVPASAQVAAPSCCNTSQPALRVFLDCNQCDGDYLRDHVAFVEFVRDRAVSDLHALVTVEGTGGGGQKWTMTLIGQGRFQSHDHKLTFSTPATASDDDRRKEFARVFKLGLAVYAADTSAAPNLDVTWQEPQLRVASRTRVPPKDPWNFWVFHLGVNGNVNGEQLNSSHNYSGNASANRTTDNWKINVQGNGDTNGNYFVLDDGTTIKSATHAWNLNTLIVKSKGPHWSLGGRASVSRSTYSNQDRAYQVAPGFEYNVFPYVLSTRKSLTVLYTIGASHYKYTELTIFNKLAETVPEHSVNVGLGLRQPWGSLNASFNFTQQLNIPERYRLSTGLETSVRLFKGFSFDLYARFDRIRNLISLRQAPATDTEVLLRLQQQATGYSYSAGFGVSYSFGSIFNSIVNPRFGGS